ncbi:hypothetical protein ACMXYV_05660 [Neptuniibacter sp. SY11_33]|uniref:hypothetical protein n=1 Tax=Neptuniibacter sp. SY11_33 TaxID=3398215 RepID=UPI0039F6251C
MKPVFFVLFYIVIAAQPSFAKDTVRYATSTKYADAKQQYFLDLLDLALENTRDTYGDYKVLPVILEVPQSRTSTLIESDRDIDVAWRMTSVELEYRLRAVPVPLLRGLMGYRIGIIRKGDQSQFSPDISKEQLQRIVIGQGHDWPDTVILRENGMNVMAGLTHTLHSMLVNKRFDLFLRALHEPWVEISDKPNLEVERYILVQYHAPMFFFVNRENERLHSRLTEGLNKAIDNGSFQALFDQHPITADIIAKANLEHRKVFKLTNPLLSDETRALIGDKRLWHSLQVDRP